MIIKRLWSWIVGRKIGETSYKRASPFIVGTISCTLPIIHWTKEDRDKIRLRYERHEWTGFKWEMTGIIEMPLPEKKR